MGSCRVYSQRANALVIEGDKARRVSMLELESGNHYWSTAKTSLQAVALSETGQFMSLPSRPLQANESWGQLYARGARAFMSTSGALTAIDTRNASVPTAVRHDTQGWGRQSLEVSEDRAYCALGQYGVLSIDL